MRERSVRLMKWVPTSAKVGKKEHCLARPFRQQCEPSLRSSLLSSAAIVPSSLGAIWRWWQLHTGSSRLSTATFLLFFHSLLCATDNGQLIVSWKLGCNALFTSFSVLLLLIIVSQETLCCRWCEGTFLQKNMKDFALLWWDCSNNSSF